MVFFQEAAALGKKVAVCDYIQPSPAGTTWGKYQTQPTMTGNVPSYSSP